jgi:hypothetical protein
MRSNRLAGHTQPHESPLLAAMPCDVPLQGGFDDVGHLVAVLFHEGEGFVPHRSDADGADGCLSGSGSASHGKNVTQKSGLSTCTPDRLVPFLYYKNEARAGRIEMTRAYRIKGTTGDVDTCAFGHTGLKKTVALAVLDADGNEGEIIYLGTDCAAKVMRTTETNIRNAASAADHERAEKVEWATEFVATYGPVDGDRRATAQLFFSRNPHARGTVTASEWVGKHLAEARAILAAR